MARVAICPYCGAPVEFKSVVSILAVCDYCRGTLLRKGEDFEGLGKMAELLEDRSPLQRGSEGRWQGMHFALVGRLQLRYAHGLWSEWHLLFDDGSSGWLSEAGGAHVLSRPAGVKDNLPAFDDIQIDQRILLDGRSFTVTNRLVAECIAGEGELPFIVGAGYPAPVVDLRDEQGGFATLDYSDDPAKPLVFLGTSVEFATLDWANLRTQYLTPATLAVRAFNCPHCGAALKVEHEGIVRVGCTGCGTVLDTSAEEVRLIERCSIPLAQPRLPLGSKGNLRGETVDIIGYMRRCMTVDHLQYCWGEYVCLGKDNALVWLTEYDGHWSIARVMERSVAVVAGKAKVGKDEFKHFQDYEARVQFVIGEFPWRVSIGERAKVADFVAPPLMLSREATDDEVSWTQTEYVEPAEIAATFGLKQPLPEPKGVYANQPNPHEEKHRSVCRRFWLFALAALAIHVLLLIFGPWRIFIKEPLTFTPDDDEPRVSREFKLDATPRLEIAHDTNLNNNWIALGMTLVNKDTGEAWQAQREIGHYAGVDDGESWSEGSRSHAVVFRDLPAGTYFLALEAELDAASPPVTTQLNVERVGSRWANLVMLVIFLAIFPIFTRVRKGSFEISRWAESDHPIVTSDSDDGGDD